MKFNLPRLVTIFVLLHIFLTFLYVVIFDNLNSQKNQFRYVENNIENIKNIILGDSTGVFAFKNSLLEKNETVNLSMYGENIICSYYKLKYLKNRYNLNFNIYINSQDYLFNRKDFCVSGNNIRLNVINYDDYIEYYNILGDIKNYDHIKLKFYFDYIFYNLYLDIYDYQNLKLLSKLLNENLYNLFFNPNIYSLKRLDKNIDQYPLKNIEKSYFNDVEKYLSMHAEDDKSYKKQIFSPVVFEYYKKISILFPKKEIHSYILPHYNWGRDQLFHGKLLQLPNYKSHFDYFEKFQDKKYFFNSSHLNEYGSIKFTNDFIEKVLKRKI